MGFLKTQREELERQRRGGTAAGGGGVRPPATAEGRGASEAATDWFLRSRIFWGR